MVKKAGNKRSRLFDHFTFAPVVWSVALVESSTVGRISVASGMLVSTLGSGIFVSRVVSIEGRVVCVAGAVAAVVVGTVVGKVVGIVSAGLLPQAHRPMVRTRASAIAKNCFIGNLHNLIYGYSMSLVVVFNQI